MGYRHTTETKETNISNKRNIVKNPNWQEADLAVGWIVDSALNHSATLPPPKQRNKVRVVISAMLLFFRFYLDDQNLKDAKCCRFVPVRRTGGGEPTIAWGWLAWTLLELTMK